MCGLGYGVKNNSGMFAMTEFQEFEMVTPTFCHFKMNLRIKKHKWRSNGTKNSCLKQTERKAVRLKK